MATLALPHLFDAVVSRFTVEGTNVPNLFGWRTSGQQLTTGPRIVWIPGDPNGSLGQVSPPRNPGRNPRPIATLDELFTVEIVSSDSTHPESERHQYQAVRELFDAWFRAVYLAAHGTVRILSTAWIGPAKERRHGAGIRAVCAIQAMIPDEPFAVVAPAEASVSVDLTELDVTEKVDVSSE